MNARTELRIADPGAGWKAQLTAWAAQYPWACLLETASGQDLYGDLDWRCGVALHPEACIRTWDALRAWESAAAAGDLLMGCLPYERFAHTLPGVEPAPQGFAALPELLLFCPEILLEKRRGSSEIRILAENPAAVAAAISTTLPGTAQAMGFTGFRPRISRVQYLETVELLRQHIREGDFYEINYTQAFEAAAHLPAPEAVWRRLLELSPVPFGGLFRWDHLWLLCASPERFLRLDATSGTVITQPIKGTAPRFPDDPAQDAAAAQALANSEKERAENVMIVDLSRHDLHQVCEPGSVTVPHLFEVQAFRQVHHLVSTVQGQTRPGTRVQEVLTAAFPPGSMTGAPKHSVCRHITRYEQWQRGLYSGCLGYLEAGGITDLNVVIRSLVYDAAAQRMSYHVGGAITWDSRAEAEYEESLLKARAIEAVFSWENGQR